MNQPERKNGYLISLGGQREDLQLMPVPSGWRIASVPLSTTAVAYGDYATVREESGGVLRVIGVKHGGWRTLHSHSPIPPDGEIVREIAARGWLGAWNAPGRLAICVPVEVFAEAQRMLEKWEESAVLTRLERSLAG